MYLFMIQIYGVDWSFSDIVVALTAGLFGLAAVIKAVKEIYVNGWKPTWQKLVAWVLLRRSHKKMLVTLVATVQRIEAQLNTNGGSSVKDIVLRTEKRVEHIQARVRHQDETSPIAIFEL